MKQYYRILDTHLFNNPLSKNYDNSTDYDCGK